MSRYIVYDPEDQTYLTPRRPIESGSYTSRRQWSTNIDDADSWRQKGSATLVRNQECPAAHILLATLVVDPVE